MIDELGYLTFEVLDLEGWARLARDVLGLGVVESAVGLELRLDDWAARIYLREGPAEDLVGLGLRVADGAVLEALAARLQAADVPIRWADPGARGVDGLLCFEDPAGNPCEAFHGPRRSPPHTSDLLDTGFVTQGQGMGHLALRARDKVVSQRFYCELLGLQLSDHIVCEIHGFPVDVTFLHCNPRHHSIALGEGLPKRLHHFMLQVGSLDDVGRCLDRCLKARVPIVHTLGRHPNDRMISFYAETPSGFCFEYGWGGLAVDDATWRPTTHGCTSEWGHHSPALLKRRARGPAAPRSEEPAGRS